MFPTYPDTGWASFQGTCEYHIPHPAFEGVAERYGDQSVSNVINNECPNTTTSRFQGEVFRELI